MKQLYTIQFITRYFIRSLILVCSFPIFGQTPTENYIKTQECLNNQCSQKKETVMYYDGLGRPKQEIHVGASPTGKNLAIHYEYDNFGRQSKDYLPVPVGYGPGIIQGLEQQNHSFYHNHYGSSIGYSEKEIENSPLDRVLKQAAPGDSWKLGSGHEVKYNYQTNSHGEVYDYRLPLIHSKVNPARLQPAIYYYHAGTLYKNLVVDENGIPSESFTDKQGRLILKRNYDSKEKENKYDTFYLYDDYGNLVHILPPELSSYLDGGFRSRWFESIMNLGYSYYYDERNRLVEKKLPGKGWEYMVYDLQNRLVGIQDSNLRESHQWLYTKYDKFGRIVVRGLSFEPRQDRLSLQQWINGLGSNNTVKSTTGYPVGGMRIYYDNSDASYGGNHYVSSVYYYDEYPGKVGTFSVEIPQLIYNQSVRRGVGLKNHLLLEIHRVVGRNDFHYNYSFYDDNSRIIGLEHFNYLGGYHKTYSELDFRGKPIELVSNHKRNQNSAEIRITERFSYDHGERLLSHTHQINGGVEENLFYNEYDELGNLKNKKVGHQPDTPLQSVDYRYNIRGWLTDINDIDSNSLEKLFSYRIGYDKHELYKDGLAGLESQYNGNISETRWRFSLNAIRSYNYLYDGLNRLKHGFYTKGYYDVVNAYNESLRYDKNGNIIGLVRTGEQDSNNIRWIDDLSYHYSPQSNQLLSVSDNPGYANVGFIDGNDQGDDYAYDSNGNLIKDLNKGIVHIRYNYLNLPERIDWKTGNYVEYAYDASGTKLRKIVSQDQKKTRTDYLNGFHYENNELQFFPTPEGYVSRRVEQGQQSFDYIYQYRDHVGNNRVSYRKGNNGLAILSLDHYYPFGLRHEGYNFTITPNPSLGFTKNHYKYNNKELQTELNLNLYDYGARNYDPTIGRWFSVDPLAEKGPQYSPYSAFFNNPIKFIDPDGKWPEPPFWWTNGIAKWNRLNNKEKNIIRWDVRFNKANDVEKNADAAFAMTEATFGRQGKGDESDAFRHAFWQAKNTQDVGENFTRKWSDAHEYGTPTNEVKTDLYMDIHNNDVGIEIGKANPKATPEELRDIILDRISKGDLLIINSDNKLIKSDGGGLKASEIRQYKTSKKIATEILKNPNNQRTKNYE